VIVHDTNGTVFGEVGFCSQFSKCQLAYPLNGHQGDGTLVSFGLAYDKGGDIPSCLQDPTCPQFSPGQQLYFNQTAVCGDEGSALDFPGMIILRALRYCDVMEIGCFAGCNGQGWYTGFTQEPNGTPVDQCEEWHLCLDPRSSICKKLLTWCPGP
jgi:hypothetical protein